MYDCIIIGMGPAGLTAGVYAARKNLSVLMLGKQYGGQAVLTSEIENYMGFEYIKGPELMNRFEEQVKKYPVEMSREEVNNIYQEDSYFRIVCEDEKEYQSNTIIIATGESPRRLGIPGEKRFTGQGVSYCATCDAPLFSGKKAAVIGSGNDSIEAVHDLIKIAEHVYLISPEKLSADRILVDKVNKADNLTRLIGWTINKISGENMVNEITLQSSEQDEKQSLYIDGIFIKSGTIPNSSIVKDMLELNQNNEIKVDCNCTTSIPGIFAAGDVTNIPEKQIIVAAGEGAKAALSANKYLLKQNNTDIPTGIETSHNIFGYNQLPMH
ncbi:MAG: FAD-dependent oxidoreductase [Clostridiales bacterium]|nr:FAD-dependent oxidoreductase [Clostridiales bacterium]MCF8021482.1 FAD-dependent oxidoreductase [Clostridiales bacterium]